MSIELKQRIEALEAQMGDASSTAFHLTGSNIAVRILLQAMLRTLTDEEFAAVSDRAIQEAQQQREAGLRALRKVGAETADLADFTQMQDSVASDLKSTLAAAKLRRS